MASLDTLEATIADLKARVSESVSKMTAALKVLVDLSSQVRALQKTSSNPVQVSPAPIPSLTDDKPGTYRSGIGAAIVWKGQKWTISRDRTLLVDGASNEVTSLTSNVTKIGINAAGNLEHVNNLGQWYEHTGQADWKPGRTEKVAVISGEIRVG